MSKTIAVQCGHGVSTDGSWDSGCVYKGHTEAGLMLKITRAAVKYLRAAGVKVISDADHGNNKNMIEDVRGANRVGCDLYVSIHCDYSGFTEFTSHHACFSVYRKLECFSPFRE